MEALVSVVIPVYGKPDHIDRALKSVLNQTYENIEAIVVDDNGVKSPEHDLVAACMEKYKLDKRIKYVCHEVNKNGSAARNTGVLNASGDFIALLDDDDEFYKEKIQRQIEPLLLDSSLAMTYCGCELFRHGEKVGEEAALKLDNPLYDILIHRRNIQTSTILMRKSIFLKMNGFDESFRRHQDWEFVARIVADYKVKELSFMGCRRNLEFRNSSSNVAVLEKYREHYLKKMQPYIERLPLKAQKEIILNNKMAVVVQYLKSKDILGYLSALRRSGAGIYGIRFTAKSIYRTIRKGGYVK
ncbi:glycosyltransferase family A protein [uncultured Eubacterium sp.]|uniref:glycosyltransferase family 2 protein n=1 Tax=uncultured Eubacterium sp. TaxID=165185 RepID=UPI00259AA625|nr:glycosyltransferase family A protein [uncultured Eubacterium sp.]